MMIRLMDIMIRDFVQNGLSDKNKADAKTTATQFKAIFKSVFRRWAGNEVRCISGRAMRQPDNNF